MQGLRPELQGVGQEYGGVLAGLCRGQVECAVGRAGVCREWVLEYAGSGGQCVQAGALHVEGETNLQHLCLAGVVRGEG